MNIKTFIETAGNFDERIILQKFHNGIEIACPDDLVELNIDSRYSQCDVAVMLGSWKPRDKDHHNVRNSVVANARCFVVVETPLLNRKVFQPNEYFRIGVNGFLNNSGKFISSKCPDDRFQALNLTWPGWKNNQDGHILLMMQLPGDASLRGINLFDWVKYALKKIRKETDRPIVIRTHPSFTSKENDDFRSFVYDTAIAGLTNLTFSHGKDRPLSNDLTDCFCTVSYSSGSSIDSILAGIPTIACDPGNFAYDISSNFFEDINNPLTESEENVMQWLYNLSYSQWTIEEMSNGAAWTHLNPIVNDILESTARRKSK